MLHFECEVTVSSETKWRHRVHDLICTILHVRSCRSYPGDEHGPFTGRLSRLYRSLFWRGASPRLCRSGPMPFAPRPLCHGSARAALNFPLLTSAGSTQLCNPSPNGLTFSDPMLLEALVSLVSRYRPVTCCFTITHLCNIPSQSSCNSPPPACEPHGSARAERPAMVGGKGAAEIASRRLQ